MKTRVSGFQVRETTNSSTTPTFTTSLPTLPYKRYTMYISANHRYVEALHFLLLQLYISLDLIFNVISGQCCAYGLVDLYNAPEVQINHKKNNHY